MFLNKGIRRSPEQLEGTRQAVGNVLDPNKTEHTLHPPALPPHSDRQRLSVQTGAIPRRIQVFIPHIKKDPDRIYPGAYAE